MLFHLIAGVCLFGSGQVDAPIPTTPPVPNATPTRIEPDRSATSVSSGPAIPQGDDAPIGDWLVRLARHRGHLVGRTDARSASLHVMAILKAACESSPTCADAYFWLYDLELRMGRPEAARESLSNYVELVPNDDTARIRHLELELEEHQTAEARAEYIRRQLTRKPLSPAFESELHGWLARHYHQQRESTRAAGEVEQALLLNPMNVAARELAYKMFGETEPALQRVELALQLISINPSQANLVWDLAEFLDRLSLHDRAQEWYHRAIELHAGAANAAVPVEFWHKLAVSYASGGNFKSAKRAANKALALDADAHTTRILRAHVLKKMNRPKEAAGDIDYVAKVYRFRIDEVIQKRNFDQAAEIAWFFCYHRPDPRQALQLASLAMEDADPSLLAKVAYGYALRLNGRAEGAIEALSPLAQDDQLAAYELAQAQLAAGNRPTALATLHRAAAIQYSGIGYDLICKLLQQHGETPPRPPLRTKVIAALDKFNRDVFDYHRHPEKFLRFSLHPERRDLPTVGPIEITFRLENVGQFPITFGEGFMARPLIAVSANAGGESYENYLQVLMNARPMLLPGESFEKTVAIDVGAVRTRLIETVAGTLPIRITAMFDPLFDRGRLAAGLGTIVAEPIEVVRNALDLSPEGITAILVRADSPDPTQRILATEQIGSLLATANVGSSEGILNALPIDTFHAALAKLLADEVWEVRAVALEAAAWSPLDPRLTVAAAPQVRSKNAVVKLLAVRLFAEQHGQRFKQVLEQLSRSDPSAPVRMMARSYLDPLTQARAEDSPD